MNDYLGGWLPDLTQARPQMNYNIRAFKKSLHGMDPVQKRQIVENLFWDIEATLQNPQLEPFYKMGLKNLQSRVLRILDPVDRMPLRHELRAWRGARSRLHRAPITETQWQSFIDDDDPTREHKQLMYGLQGNYMQEVDRRRLRPMRVPSQKQKQNPWIEHLRQYRLANPTVPFTEAATLARESYEPIRPGQVRHVRNPYPYLMTPSGPVLAPRPPRAPRRPRRPRAPRVVDLDVAAVPLSGAPPVDFQ